MTAKWPLELQITTHFKNPASGTSKRDSLDDKLITHFPKHPSKNRNEQPPNVAARQGGSLDLSEEVREVGITPAAADNLTEAAPEELDGDASEENVIQGLLSPTKWANPIARAVMELSRQMS